MNPRATRGILYLMPTTAFSTPQGTCSVSWNEEGLTRFCLPEENLPESDGPRPAWIDDLIVRVREHYSGKMRDFSGVTLDWSLVSAFQQQVYRQTQAVPPGVTTTYGEIAQRLGLGRDGARPVGVALGSNPWPLVVPCHRVVAADGKMTGFSAPGGIRTKTRLLALEGAELLSE